jgi:hypothetical protein
MLAESATANIGVIVKSSSRRLMDEAPDQVVPKFVEFLK